MGDVLYLTKMTCAIAQEYFSSFTFDPATLKEGQVLEPFQYSDRWLKRYLNKYSDCVHMAIMLENGPIGEVLFKRIDPANKTAVFSIHLQNDGVKGKGIGTAATKAAIRYAFDELHLKVIYADALKRNERSNHVLQKVGFHLIGSDTDSYYYELQNNVLREDL